MGRDHSRVRARARRARVRSVFQRKSAVGVRRKGQGQLAGTKRVQRPNGAPAFKDAALAPRIRSRKVPKVRQHLPKSCPPEDAVPSEGEHFRLIVGALSLQQAFLSYTELGRTCPKNSRPCEWGSVSLFRDRAGVERLLDLGGQFEGALVARGTLTAEMGSAKSKKEAKSSHVDFWPFEGAQPWEAFAVEEPRK